MDPLHDAGLPIEVAPVPAAGAAFFGPPGSTIGVGQERTKWCWAASVQMLRRAVELREKTQCEIAAGHLRQPCCEDPEPCNVPCRFDHLERLLGANGMRSQHQRSQLTAVEFWRELHARRPILLGDIFENGIDGHVRVVFGWQQLPRGRSVARLADPAESKQSATAFEELQRSAWRETWLRIEVTDGAI